MSCAARAPLRAPSLRPTQASVPSAFILPSSAGPAAAPHTPARRRQCTYSQCPITQTQWLPAQVHCRASAHSSLVGHDHGPLAHRGLLNHAFAFDDRRLALDDRLLAHDLTPKAPAEHDEQSDYNDFPQATHNSSFTRAGWYPQRQVRPPASDGCSKKGSATVAVRRQLRSRAMHIACQHCSLRGAKTHSNGLGEKIGRGPHFSSKSEPGPVYRRLPRPYLENNCVSIEPDLLNSSTL